MIINSIIVFDYYEINPCFFLLTILPEKLQSVLKIQESDRTKQITREFEKEIGILKKEISSINEMRQKEVELAFFFAIISFKF